MTNTIHGGRRRPQTGLTPSRCANVSLAAALALALTACGGGGGGGGDDTPAESGPRQVSIQFAAKAGQNAIDCNTPIAALGTGAIGAELSDLRFYVSELALIKADGSTEPLTLAGNDWQHAESGVALIDLEDGTGACVDRGTAGSNAEITGSVPAGTYKGVTFTLGVPGAYNHSDTAAAPAPLDLQAMGWSWQAGRKYVKIELAPVGGVHRPADPNANPPVVEGYSARWNLHLGSTGCTGNPVSGETVSCAASNRVELKFDNFDPDTQRFVLDLQAVLLTTDLSTDLGGPYGCMSGKTDPECGAVFEALALDLASGTTVAQGRDQRLFRIEAK